jgi:hypothetical protein
MSVDHGPALTDSRGMGGTTALHGFDYQLWNALVRLPRWLRNPSFEGLIFEGLEDFEARFFAPHAPKGHLLERYQSKSAVLDRNGLVAVFESFREYDQRFPNTARLHTLVTPGLPPSLTWLVRDPLRVRRARPFYAPFADVRAASDATLLSDLVTEFGHEVGDFFFNRVEIFVQTMPDLMHARVAFGAALDAAEPGADVPASRSAATFDALAALVGERRGMLIGRAEAIALIAKETGRPLYQEKATRIFIRSAAGVEDEARIEIDAIAFSRDGNRLPPDSLKWEDELIRPLRATSTWIQGHGLPRVALSGEYRLSTAYAVGWAFRSAVGFEIDIATRAGVWSTDDRPAPGALLPAWQYKSASKLDGDSLIVVIGVIRNPLPDVMRQRACTDESVLAAYFADAITSAPMLQGLVSQLKKEIDSTVARLGAQRIALYFAGPAFLAMAIGHRWNALPPTQLHEYISAEKRYVVSAMLS